MLELQFIVTTKNRRNNEIRFIVSVYEKAEY